MEQLPRDENHITVGGAVASNDVTDVEALLVDPSTDYVLVDLANDSLIATSATMDKRDQNYVPTMYGVSSVDGITPVPIRTDSNGVILVNAIPI